MYNVLFLMFILPQLAKCTFTTYQEAKNDFLKCLEEFGFMEGIFANRCIVSPWCKKDPIFTKLNSFERYLTSKGNTDQITEKVLSLVDIVCNKLNIEHVGSKERCIALMKKCADRFRAAILEFDETQNKTSTITVSGINEVPELPSITGYDNIAYNKATDNFFGCLDEFCVYDEMCLEDCTVWPWYKKHPVTKKLDSLARHVSSKVGDTNQAFDEISQLVNVVCNNATIKRVGGEERCTELTKNCADGFCATISKSFN